MGFRSPYELGKIDENNGETDCNEQRGLVGSPPQKMEGNPFDQDSQEAAAQNRSRNAEPKRTMEISHDGIADEGPGHEDLSMGKSDEPEGSKDNSETQGNEGVYASLGNPINDLFK